MIGTTFLVDPDVLEACVERADRTLEVQRKELTELYARTEGLVRLTVAGLAGIIATVGLLIGSGVDLDGISFSGLAMGTVDLLAGLFLFISVVTGFPRPVNLSFGPRIDILVDELHDRPWELRMFQWYELKSLSEAYLHNDRLNDRLQRRQGLGLSFLAISTVALTTSLSYILGGMIPG